MQNTLTPAWLAFRVLVTPAWLENSKVQVGHITMALDVLQELLISLFGSTTLERLLQPPADAAFFQRIAVSLHAVVAGHTWKRATSRQVLGLLSRILSKRECPSSVLRALRLPAPKRAWNHTLGRFGRLPLDHPVRARLESWLLALSTRSRNRSTASLRNIMHFYVHVLLPACRVDLTAWSDADAERILALATSREGMQSVCAGSSTRVFWMKLFVRAVLGRKDVELAQVDTQRKQADAETGDPHRISSAELDKIHAVAKQDLENELFFTLLLTTGMRIQAFVNIKTRDVAELIDGRWQAKTEGRTMEKGPKLFTFLLTARARELVAEWLNRRRGWDPCEYLFPGRFEGRRTTEYFRARFRAVCRQAGLRGRQFHPHALRHAYAHMLLESGNQVETIAKLINHSSSATTEKYYLRESAADVARRAKIPWMPAYTPNAPTLPAFLQSVSNRPEDPLQAFIADA